MCQSQTHAALGHLDQLRHDIVGADLEARGPANSTPLFLAAWNGQAGAVQPLLDAGASANLAGRAGESAWKLLFKHIWSNPHRAIARLLLEHGVQCTFHEACVLSHIPTVRKILVCDPEAKDRPNEKGALPIEIAILNADAEQAALLLEAGAGDPKGQAPALIDGSTQDNRNLSKTLYRNCNLRTANFHDCNMTDAVFSDVNLSGVRLDNVNLSGARIDNAFITGLTIYGIEVGPLLTKEIRQRAARKIRDR